MTIMVLVESVRPEEDYVLQIGFNNGEIRYFDMKPYLRYPVFHRLRDPVFFELARTEYGTVVWPNDIDIAPETLYAQSTPVASAQSV